MVRDLMLGSPVLDGPDLWLAASLVGGQMRADVYVYTLNDGDETRDPHMELTKHVVTWRTVDGNGQNVRDVIMWAYNNAVAAARDVEPWYEPMPAHVRDVELLVREFEGVVISASSEL